MPRRKTLRPQVTALGDPSGASVTRQSRTRRIAQRIVLETGDPYQDGELWLSRITMTYRLRRERKNGSTDWARYYRWYRGHQWADRGDLGQAESDNPRETATSNKLGSIVNATVPFMVNREIKFLLKARRPGDRPSAKIQESLLNYEWIERKMQRQIKMCAKDEAIIGHCVAKIGYTVEVDEARRKKDGIINYKDYIRRDAPFLERVNPLLFIADLAAPDHTLHTSRWCSQIFFETFSDVMSNKNYDKSVLADISVGELAPAVYSGFHGIGEKDPTSVKTLRMALPEDKLVCMFEIWDKKFRQRMIYADGIPIPLLVEPWPYDYLDNFPFIMSNYIDVPNDFYGVGIMAGNEDQQIQLNIIRTAQFNHINANTPRYAAAEGTHPDEVTKFTDGAPNTVVVGEFKPIQMASLIADFQIAEAAINRDIIDGTGADDLVQGQKIGDRTTAGEIGTRARLTGLKYDMIVGNFEEFVEDGAKQVLQHLKANRTLPDVIEIVGPEGAEWREYTPEEIQAEVDVSVETFSAPKDDPKVELQQAIQVMELCVRALPVLQESGAPETINFPNLLAFVLDRFDEPDIDQFFRPAQPQGLLPPAPEEGGSQGAGAGLPPALAGMSAPRQMPATPSTPSGAPPNVQQLLAGLMSGGSTR
jgi:hypothetical protein